MGRGTAPQTATDEVSGAMRQVGKHLLVWPDSSAGDGAGARTMAQDRLSVVVSASHSFLRDLLARALGTVDGLEVAGQAVGLTAAAGAVARLRPQAVLLAVDGDPGDALVEAVSAIKAAGDDCGVVVLSETYDPRTAESLATLACGGWAYLPRAAVDDLPGLAGALRACADGLVVLDRHGHSGNGVGHLTRRQLEVLELMARGLTNAAIARRLVLEEKSVENHINAIFNQMGVNHDPGCHPRVRAVLNYLRLDGAAGAGDEEGEERRRRRVVG